jgi:hypothetical protein
MTRLRLAAPALAFVAAACAQPPASPPPVEWPWPRVAGSDGRSALQLQTILRNAPHESGSDATWQVQGQVEHDDPAVLLSDLHATIRVTTDDGVERVFDRDATTLDAIHRGVVLRGLELGPDPQRIAALEVELRLVHVTSWATTTETLGGLGEERTTIVAPFEFRLLAGKEAVLVTACTTDASRSSGRPRAAADLLSHRWAARAALVQDARESDLASMFGGGSGGVTTCGYTQVLGVGMFGVAYPVRVTLRVPDAVETEVVRYRVTDLDLSSVPRRR